MLTLRLLACAALLSGCDIVFSVDRVPVGQSVEVRGSLHRRTIDNDAADVPRLSALLPPTSVAADVSFSDGSKQELTLGPDGELSFTWPDDSQPYTLAFRTPFMEIAYQLSSTNPRLVERVAGRGNRLPVSQSTRVHLTFPTSTPPSDPSIFVELESTGIWTRRAMSGVVTTPFDWSTTFSPSGPIGLLEAGPDAMYILEFEAGLGIYRISRFGSQHQPAFVDGQDNAVPFDLVPQPFDQCASITVDHEAEKARLLSLMPEATGAAMAWRVLAAPAAEFQPEIGFPLTSRNLESSTPSPFSEVIQYANPFEGLAPYAQFEVATDGAALVHTAVSVPLDSACTPVVVPTSAVKLATRITVSGTELKSAGQSIAIDRSKPVPIAFNPTSTGDADFFVTQVVDANPRIIRARIVSTTPRVTIDPDLLLPAHSYIIIVYARTGHPNAAMGDFETTGGLFASGNTTSTTFLVQ